MYIIIIILVLVLIKAIFSASDTAFTFFNKSEIKQLSKKDKKAEKIRILMEDSNKFFGIIEVSINMCELLAGAVVSITIVEYLIDFFGKNENRYKYIYSTFCCYSYSYIILYNVSFWRSTS